MSPRRISSKIAPGSARVELAQPRVGHRLVGRRRAAPACPSTGRRIRSPSAEQALGRPDVLAVRPRAGRRASAWRSSGMSALTSRRTTPANLRAVSSAVTMPMMAPGARGRVLVARQVRPGVVLGAAGDPEEGAGEPGGLAGTARAGWPRSPARAAPGRARPGSGTQRGRLARHLDAHEAAARAGPVSRTWTARLRPRLLMNGKGWAASTASGVRIGLDGLGEVARAGGPAGLRRGRRRRGSGCPAAPGPGAAPPPPGGRPGRCLGPQLGPAGGELLGRRQAVRPRLAGRRSATCRRRPPMRFMANSS